MTTCPKCGAQINENDAFCRSCGASMPAKADKTYEEKTHTREREACFGEVERPRRDYLGLVSFGIFVLIVGIIFIANPNLISESSSWIEQMTKDKTLTRPPAELISSATLLFGMIGVSNFFMAGIRYITDKSRRRVLSDILSGVALALFAYLIYLYGMKTIEHGLTVLATEAVACGILIILYSAIRYLFPNEFR